MVFGTNPTDKSEIMLESENPSVVMTYSKAIKFFDVFKKESDFSVTHIANEEKIGALYSSLGVQDAIDFDEKIIVCTECTRSFLQGLFLSCGTVTYPESSYHMEFSIRGQDRAEKVIELLSLFSDSPKLIERRGELYGVYYKDSEQVVDVLGYLGANKAAFKTLDIKIYKEMRNEANRLSNCETANIGKTVRAANAQMAAIHKIIDMGKADELPSELRETLDLRAAFPEATLNELAEMHTPPITKSGVNHRLKRLIDFSLKIK